MIHGVLVLDKPKGMTSAQVVEKIKRKFNFQKVGHGGTLDPLATGVLPICINQATKISSWFLGADKVYEGVFLLGVETDTQDILGKVIATHPVRVTEQEIQAAMEKFKGAIQQIPPMYSAIKKGGKPLYRYARANQEVERLPRQIHIFDFQFLGKSGHEVQFRVHCSKGTYVRTLCADVGTELKSGACVKELKRVRTGNCELQHAIGLEALNSQNLTGTPHWKTIAEIRSLCYKADNLK